MFSKILLAFTLTLNCVIADVVFLTQNDLVQFCGLTYETPNANRLFDPLTTKGQLFNTKFTLDRFDTIDDVNEIFKVSGTLYIEWNVTCWSRELFDLVNITSGGSPRGVTIFAKDWRELFYPKIRLRNAIFDSGMEENFNIYMQLQSRLVKSPDEILITVRWWRYGLFSSSCPLYLTKFPFDQQTCSLRLISHASYVVVEKSELEIGYLGSEVATANSNWDFLNGFNYIKPAVGEIPNQIIFEFHLKRRSYYFVINFMVPCILLVILEILALFLPPNLTLRPVFMGTVVLALIVLQGSVLLTCPSVTQQIFMVSYILQLAILCSAISVESLLICCFTQRFANYVIEFNQTSIKVENLIDFFTIISSISFFVYLNGYALSMASEKPAK